MKTLSYVLTDWHEQLPAGHQHRDVSDVAVDAADRVILYARADSEVLIYESDGRFVRAFGREIFSNSHGITAGPDGLIYCADNGDHTVRKFSPSGELLMTLGTPGQPSDTGYDGKHNYDTIRCGAGPFNCCTKAAIAPNGDVYVSDGYGNARVHHFSARGELVRSWGEPGIEPGQFNLPHGIALAADGRVLVCDRENDRIQIFSPEGEYLTAWTDVRRPSSVQVGSDGLVYVVELSAPAGRRSRVHGVDPDRQAGRVSIFNADGTLLLRWGDLSRTPGNFIAPHGLAVDSRGDIYVAEVARTFYSRYEPIPSDFPQLHKFVRA